MLHTLSLESENTFQTIENDDSTSNNENNLLLIT